MMNAPDKIVCVFVGSSQQSDSLRSGMHDTSENLWTPPPLRLLDNEGFFWWIVDGVQIIINFIVMIWELC